MTIIDTTPTQAADLTPAEEAVQGPEVRRISPHTLVVEDNIRSQVDLDRAFVNSIKLHGVIVPILAHPDQNGNIIVRDGQRRTLAAREADAEDVPVYVVDASDEKRIRIIQQYITNEHRAGLTDTDRAEAWRQLALDGMSVTAIAKQTGTKRTTVKTGLAVAESDIAKTAVTQHALTLDQALILTEFEDDPDALAELTSIAAHDPESFDHYAQRHLDDKATKEEIAALRAQYEADGYTVMDYPAWGDEDVAFLHDLLTADGERVTEENYAGKDGHAIAIGERWGSIDIAHVVVNWREHGLTSIRHNQPNTRSGSMTEEEKAERRRVVANNKAWVSAEKVRRAWVTKLLGRKRLPSQALAFAATVIADNRHEVARAASDGHDMAATLLSLDGQRHYGQPHPIAAMTQATPTKAGHALLAVALGALEAATNKNSWRNPDQATRAYLDQLAAWGYTLSDVETLITDPDSAHRAEDTTNDADTPADADASTEEETGEEVNGEDTSADETDTTSPDPEPEEEAPLDNPAEAEEVEVSEESPSETDDADAASDDSDDEPTVEDEPADAA
ncbi:MAG TPA: chromosome partitioning protein [Microbacterium sp.]|uniref:ParB/RepB/Spo0J family partition protein n=1 Tax=Microbacterium sp. UBA1097 TaxID=1946941 RepID=UPI000E81DEBE|nr:ParB N-terminal domain-containing protein [Microbacterium sp. UBA1097]HBS73544.1 chromosome partitioning protein [Microbacterium sp.]|tara:strand:- start:2335 stop:4023 length:1689 start_codon:yes stop_codon:yes gene_type:complete